MVRTRRRHPQRRAPRFIAQLLGLAVLAGATVASAEELRPPGKVLRCSEGGQTLFKDTEDTKCFDVNQPFTMEGYVRIAPHHANDWGPAILHRAELRPGKYDAVTLRFYHEEPENPLLALGITLGTPRGWFTVKGPELYLMDRWIHVAACRDNKEIRVYLNGKLYAQADVTGRRFNPLGQPMAIGFAGDVRWVRISQMVRYDQAFIPPRQPPAPDRATRLLVDMQDVRGLHVDLLPDPDTTAIAIDSSGKKHHGSVDQCTWISYWELDEAPPEPNRRRR